jgi:hypothetical protein
LTTKSSGSSGENQSGCILEYGSIITVPSDDWCMVGSRMPSAMIQGSALSSFGPADSAKVRCPAVPEARQRSRTDGENSIQITIT